MRDRAARLLSILLLSLAVMACGRAEAGSPEAVADAFSNAYFRLADQEAAKRYTAFGATKMLDKELADVRAVRKDGFSAGESKLQVSLERGARSERGHRVRFQYTLSYQDGAMIKYADVELSKVHGDWKVVRVGLSDKPPPATSAP